MKGQVALAHLCVHKAADPRPSELKDKTAARGAARNLLWQPVGWARVRQSRIAGDRLASV